MSNTFIAAAAVLVPVLVALAVGVIGLLLWRLRTIEALVKERISETVEDHVRDIGICNSRIDITRETLREHERESTPTIQTVIELDVKMERVEKDVQSMNGKLDTVLGSLTRIEKNGYDK